MAAKYWISKITGVVLEYKPRDTVNWTHAIEYSALKKAQKRIKKLEETLSLCEDVALNAIALCATKSGYETRMREVQELIEFGTIPKWLEKQKE